MDQIRVESPTPLYPLRFAPIFQYRLWGGRRLAEYSRSPLPGEGPIGEAWILSDRDDFPSLVSDGGLAGKTIKQLLERWPVGMLGAFASKYQRFPLLLKFLDAREMLSVQVHPSDQEKQFLPPGENGKTEAWVVLESDAESLIYAGLRPGTTAENLRSLNAANANSYLAGFNPKVGEGVYIEAGTVHALGGGVLVFEVQQNSDVTFRLFDWDRVDTKTGKPRELHIDQSIECTNFSTGPIGPVTPKVEKKTPVDRELFFQGEHFTLWKNQGSKPFPVGSLEYPRIVVCADGRGNLVHAGSSYSVVKGDVYLLPAAVGVCEFVPEADCELLEIALPES